MSCKVHFHIQECRNEEESDQKNISIITDEQQSLFFHSYLSHDRHTTHNSLQELPLKAR